jgi:AraC-like DNA-binding protein
MAIIHTTKHNVFMSISIPLSCQVLFESLNKQIENHLNDPNFDVGKLLRFIGMSRTGLHRKLKQCVGMSTTEYIRYVRVQCAVALLANHPDWSISDIAYAVGFSSPSYFTRAFEEFYREAPSAYKRAH